MARGEPRSGLALEAAQRYDEAITYLKLYMVTNPGGDTMRAAQDEVYKIEAKKQLAAKAAKEPSPVASPATKENAYEAWLKKIDGRKYTVRTPEGFTGVIDVRGKVLIVGQINPAGRYDELSRNELRGREASYINQNAFGMGETLEERYLISEDGDRITMRRRFRGNVSEVILLWQR